jgi:hypothetical protein
MSALSCLRDTAQYDAILRGATSINGDTSRQIEIDLNRTFAEQADFAAALAMKADGQDGSKSGVAEAVSALPDVVLTTAGCGDMHDALRRLLRAFCALHPATGYLQSMNFLAAFALLVVGRQKEADAFVIFEVWQLSRVFHSIKWLPSQALVAHALRGYYTPSMLLLRVDCAVFKALVRERLPDLAAHLDAVGCADVADLFLPRWLLCVFLNCFPGTITTAAFCGHGHLVLMMYTCSKRHGAYLGQPRFRRHGGT